MSKRVINDFHQLFKSYKNKSNRHTNEYLTRQLNERALDIKLRRDREEMDHLARDWFFALSEYERIYVVQHSIRDEKLWIILDHFLPDYYRLYRAIVLD